MYLYQDNDGTDERTAQDRFKTGQVYFRLKSLLATQKIPPHTKLDPGVLANRLNMSRTPVREALIHLSIEDIILNIPGSGYFTKPLNVEDIAEDYELALTIIRHIVDTDVETVRRAHLGLPRFLMSSSDLPSDADIPFHFKSLIEDLYDRIARLAGNRKYLHVIHTFISRTTFVRYLDLQRPERLTQITKDMEELVGLLDFRDAKGALANLDRQFKSKIDILYDLVREGNLRTSKASPDWLERLEQ